MSAVGGSPCRRSFGRRGPQSAGHPHSLIDALASSSASPLTGELSLDRLEFPHQPLGFLDWISFTGSAQPKELNHINAPLAQFQTPNQAPFTTKLLGQLPLRQSRFAAQGNQPLANTLAMTRMNGFLHARMLRALSACFQIASMKKTIH